MVSFVLFYFGSMSAYTAASPKPGYSWRNMVAGLPRQGFRLLRQTLSVFRPKHLGVESICCFWGFRGFRV